MIIRNPPFCLCIVFICCAYAQISIYPKRVAKPQRRHSSSVGLRFRNPSAIAVALGDPKATTYNIVNGVRIAKNLVTFPIESILIVAVLGAFIPILKKFKAVPASQNELIVTKKHVIAVAITTLLSVGLILFYVFFLKDFISAHNIKLF